MKLAKDLNNEEISISEAKRGENYYCLICNSPVVIKRGNKKEPHFAHLQNTGNECELKYQGIYENYSAIDLEKPISNKTDYSVECNKLQNEGEIKESSDVVIEDLDKKWDIDSSYEYIKTTITFSKDQSNCMDMFVDKLKNNFKGVETLGFSGRAGSGKSVMLAKMVEMCDMLKINYCVATFTGKASQILRDKGVKSAQTIHSLMYKPITDDKTGRITGWKKSVFLPFSIIFLDEYSMISKNIVLDLMKYKIPIVFLGDKKQLPPISEPCSILEDRIDYELHEVLRQAEGNPIIKNANDVRDGKPLRVGIKEKTEQGLFITLDKMKDRDLIQSIKLKATQIICGKNKTRHDLNSEYREMTGKKGLYEIGEKLVILKNNKSTGVFNGQIIEILEILDEPYKDWVGFTRQLVRTSDGDFEICLDTLIDYDFNFQEPLALKKAWTNVNYVEPLFVNMAYCLTTHKLQGSQSETTLIFASDLLFMKYMNKDINVGQEMYQRSIYTAVTRSTKNCIVVL